MYCLELPFLRANHYLFFQSRNINCRIKCKICSKLTTEGPEVVLVSLLSTLIIFDTLFWFVFFVCMLFFFASFERERRMEYFTALIHIYL